MDIKFVNPNLVSPFKTPVHVVKPALKSSTSTPTSRSLSSRRDSQVKFSDTIQRDSRTPSDSGIYGLVTFDS